MPRTSLKLPLFERAAGIRERTAIVAPEGAFNFGELLDASGWVATRLLAGRDDLDSERICYLVPPGWHHVAVQWGIWRSGGLAVPLATSHPAAELAYVLDDASPEAVVAHPDLIDRVSGVAAERQLPVLQTPALLAEGPTGVLPDLAADRSAMMLYTSGTTGRPKGVVVTHGNLQAQVSSLSDAWGWSEHDHILLHLPLHHVHGITNILTSALWNGAT